MQAVPLPLLCLMILCVIRDVLRISVLVCLDLRYLNSCNIMFVLLVNHKTGRLSRLHLRVFLATKIGNCSFHKNLVICERFSVVGYESIGRVSVRTLKE